jgi:hypothetical protein
MLKNTQKIVYITRFQNKEFNTWSLEEEAVTSTMNIRTLNRLQDGYNSEAENRSHIGVTS